MGGGGPPQPRSQRSSQIYNSSGTRDTHRHSSSGHAGYGQGPPPGADPQLWEWFSTVDADRSGAIDVHELQAALVNGEYSP